MTAPAANRPRRPPAAAASRGVVADHLPKPRPVHRLAGYGHSYVEVSRPDASRCRAASTSTSGTVPPVPVGPHGEVSSGPRGGIALIAGQDLAATGHQKQPAHRRWLFPRSCGVPVTDNMSRESWGRRGETAMPGDPGAARESVTRAVTMVEVARTLGLSHQTVPRVLNDHPSVRPDTRHGCSRRSRQQHRAAAGTGVHRDTESGQAVLPPALVVRQSTLRHRFGRAETSQWQALDTTQC